MPVALSQKKVSQKSTPLNDRARRLTARDFGKGREDAKADARRNSRRQRYILKAHSLRLGQVLKDPEGK